MSQFLVFRLYGVMASWGDIAVGEVRPSASHPSRSEILGLIAAALGIERDQGDTLKNVFSGYDVAIKMISQGILLHDYHTVQVPGKGKCTYRTRKDELNFDPAQLGTILSFREYYCEPEVIVSIRARDHAPYSLADMKHALEYPHFVLYLGRKSCPLGLPLKPQIVEAPGFKGSLDNAIFPSVPDGKGRKEMLNRYYWEGKAGDMEPTEITERYDEPVDKRRWQFTQRKENYSAGEKT